MRERIFKFRILQLPLFLTVLFVLPIGMIAFLMFPGQVAKIEASYHIWRNHYVIKTYGYRFGDREYDKMLKHYGISYVRVAGGEVYKPIKDYVAHYNSIMREAIWRDLGVRLEK